MRSSTSANEYRPLSLGRLGTAPGKGLGFAHSGFQSLEMLFEKLAAMGLGLEIGLQDLSEHETMGEDPELLGRLRIVQIRRQFARLDSIAHQLSPE